VANHTSDAATVWLDGGNPSSAFQAIDATAIRISEQQTASWIPDWAFEKPKATAQGLH
jgi:hypothetical protein